MGRIKVDVKKKLPKARDAWYHQKEQGKEARNCQGSTAFQTSGSRLPPCCVKRQQFAVFSFSGPRNWHHPDTQWGQGLQIYKPRVGFKEQKGLQCGGKMGGRHGWRTSPTEVTFCSEPCQPEGSTLSGAKPICSRVNKKQQSSQKKTNLQL